MNDNQRLTMTYKGRSTFIALHRSFLYKKSPCLKCIKLNAAVYRLKADAALRETV